MTDYLNSQFNTSPKYHLYALIHDRATYMDQLQAATWSALSSSVKGAVMAAVWMTREEECRKFFFNFLMGGACTVTELYKMFFILDTRRRKQQLKNKIADGTAEDKKRKVNEISKKENAPTKRKRQGKVDKLRRELRILEAVENQHQKHEKDEPWFQDSAVQELYDSASVSGALAKHIQKWARTLKSDYLEFVMLEIDDKYNWQFVMDLAHLSPRDFCLPYFSADVFGEPIPDKCFVSAMRKLLCFKSSDEREFAALFEAMTTDFPQIYLSYPSLRLKPNFVSNPAVVENLARHIPLESVIWYFEEMYQTSTECAAILMARLDACDQHMFKTSDAKVYSFGKLMERILMFQNKTKLPGLAKRVTDIATIKLSSLIEKWGAIREGSSSKKVAVIGDASSSMQCAIEAASILAGFCSVLLDGELTFFNRTAIESPHPKPSTVAQLLEVCNKIQASGATAHAAGFHEYFEKKIWVDAVVMVTDEEENIMYKGRYFAKLFKEYQQKVNPNAKLVIVCVGKGNWMFRENLEEHGIEHTTVHIDQARPDLTKFDALIGDIAYNCTKVPGEPTDVSPVSGEEEWMDVIPCEEPSTEKTTDVSNGAKEAPAELDLTFIVDNTYSMSPWIKSAQENAQRIIRDIKAAEATDVRFALVSYRDHPPQDDSFVTKTKDFTCDVTQMQEWVDEMTADGGGDLPEAVADGLHDALHLSYRPNSTKVAVLIADAPPHGLGSRDDGFPEGCPHGHDPLQIARAMAARGITVYSVICGNFEGQAFFQGISQMTGGQYVPISSAHLLASVIVGGAQEEMSLEKLMQDAQDAVFAEEEAAGHQLDDDELASRLQAMFARMGGTKTRATRLGGADLPDYEASASIYSEASTLADIRKTKGKAHLALGSFGDGIDKTPAMAGATFSAEEEGEGPSHFQCRRMVGKSRARGKAFKYSRAKKSSR